MPWTQSDAIKKTHKASTPKLANRWQAVANSMRDRGASDATSIKAANGVVAKAWGRVKRM